jgi:hypothetical protein
MPTIELRPPSCPRCSAPMEEVGREPHPKYPNLVNVRFCCTDCGHEMEAALAPLEGPKKRQPGG